MSDSPNSEPSLEPKSPDSPNLEPKLNLLNLAGSMGKLVDIASKLSNPATLAQLEADGKLAVADVQQLMEDAKKAADDLEKILKDLQTALGA